MKKFSESNVRGTEHSNVYLCDLDLDLTVIDRVRDSFEQQIKDPVTGQLHGDGLAFEVVEPGWGHSDIRWISAADATTFGWFQASFEALKVAESFQFLTEMTMFSGYIVARSHMEKSNFHVDFTGTGGSAFTLMTPLYDMTDLEVSIPLHDQQSLLLEA